MLPRTWALLKETTNILLEGVPDGIAIDDVTKAITGLPGVTGLHDLHIWAITSGVLSLSAHVILADGADGDKVRDAVVAKLDEKFEIEHVTLQTERKECRDGRNHHGLH